MASAPSGTIALIVVGACVATVVFLVFCFAPLKFCLYGWLGCDSARLERRNNAGDRERFRRVSTHTRALSPPNINEIDERISSESKDGKQLAETDVDTVLWASSVGPAAPRSPLSASLISGSPELAPVWLDSGVHPALLGVGMGAGSGVGQPWLQQPVDQRSSFLLLPPPPYTHHHQEHYPPTQALAPPPSTRDAPGPAPPAPDLHLHLHLQPPMTPAPTPAPVPAPRPVVLTRRTQAATGAVLDQGRVPVESSL